MSVVKGLNETDEMREGCKYYQEMEDLVAASNHIELARSPSFWEPNLYHSRQQSLF